MESLHREILAVGTLSPKNTSLTSPPPPPPAQSLDCLIPSSWQKTLCTAELWSFHNGGTAMFARISLTLALTVGMWQSLQSHMYTNPCTWLHMRVNAQKQLTHTHVIRHVRNFYSVGHVSICGVTQTCSLSRNHPCFVIIQSVFTVMILTVSAVVDLRSSAYTETLQPGTSWSRRATSWRSQTLAWPETSTTSTTIKRRQMWAHTQKVTHSEGL